MYKSIYIMLILTLLHHLAKRIICVRDTNAVRCYLHRKYLYAERTEILTMPAVAYDARHVSRENAIPQYTNGDMENRFSFPSAVQYRRDASTMRGRN